MAKLKVNVKGGSVLVKSKLLHTEQVNERELQLLMTSKIGSFLPPTVTGKKKIEYAGNNLVVLRNYVKNGVDQPVFFTIIAQIVEAVKCLERNGLFLKNLMLNLDCMFINATTLELKCVYQPIVSPENVAMAMSCMREIALVAESVPKPNNEYLRPFIMFLDHTGRFSATEIEDYIRKAAPMVYKRMRKDVPPAPPAPVRKAPEPKAPPRPDPSKTNLDLYFDFASGGNSLLDDPDSIGLMEDSIGLSDEATGLMDDGMDQTVLLEDESEPTMLLGTGETSHARIIRLATGEEAVIDKAVFRIGKERSHVDYCVTGNKTVSRVHAEIVNRDGDYFLYDNHSTNKSYVNGRMIPTQKETRIVSGDILKFSDEEFEFRV